MCSFGPHSIILMKIKIWEGHLGTFQKIGWFDTEWAMPHFRYLSTRRPHTLYITLSVHQRAAPWVFGQQWSWATGVITECHRTAACSCLSSKIWFIKSLSVFIQVNTCTTTKQKDTFKFIITWVRVDLGTSRPGYELTWVRFFGYELTWVQVETQDLQCRVQTEIAAVTVSQS